MKKLFFTITFMLFAFILTPPCFAKQMNILVNPFENTGSKKYSWISAGMTDTVISDLTSIQNISVVSNQDRKKVLEEMKFIFSGLAEDEKMIKLGKLTGANVIFSGSYLVSGNRIRVYARLVNVETGEVESSTKLDGTINDIFDLQDNVIFTLMGGTKKITIADIQPVSLTKQDKRKITEKPRYSITAYEWYSKGLEIEDNDPKKALTYFKNALDIEPNYTDALISAGFIAGIKLSLFSEGIEYFEKARRIFNGRNETNSYDYARLMLCIGTVYRSKGQTDRALEYYISSQFIRDKLELQNTNGYAGLMMNIGNAYSDKGQTDRALEYYMKSQSIYDRLEFQNTADYAHLLLATGVVYKYKGQIDRALEYYMYSQSIMDRMGLQNTSAYATLMMNIGNLCKDMGQLMRALEYYMNSQSIMDKMGLQNTGEYAMLMMNIGILYRKDGQPDRALEYYMKDKSIEDGLGLQNTGDYAVLMMNIGNLYVVKGQFDRALAYYMNSQSIMNKLGLQNTVGYATLLSNIALLYENQGNSGMAGRYYRMAYNTYVWSGYSGQGRDTALKNAERLGY